MRGTAYFLLIISVFAHCDFACAETPEVPPVKVDHLKIAVTMFSSAQSWTDHRILGEYRLQNRTGTEAWRLLGPGGRTEISGTRELCERRLVQRAAGKLAEAVQGDVVVLVHGLFQTRATMEPMESYLKQSGKRQVINFGYASTRADIEGHAKSLEEVLHTKGPEAKISFVGHSMGCIVIRAMLANREACDWKLGRVVMLGPPNQGAEMARRLVDYRAVRSLLGPGFEQLADPKRETLAALPSPKCEFAVIAGESPKWLLNNPLIKGDDDWIVGVSETRLEGAKCDACVHSHHGNIVHDPEVLEMVDAFLETGKLQRTKRFSEGK